MRINKDLIKTIIIIILIVLLVGIFFVPSYNQTIYERGFTNGQLNVIQTQMQTGNVFVAVNGTIHGYSLNTLCGGQDEV